MCYPHLMIMQGDMFGFVAVEAAIKGKEAVFCVLGVKPGVTILVCSVGTKNIFLAMQAIHLSRPMCSHSWEQPCLCSRVTWAANLPCT